MHGWKHHFIDIHYYLDKLLSLLLSSFDFISQSLQEYLIEEQQGQSRGNKARKRVSNVIFIIIK